MSLTGFRGLIVLNGKRNDFLLYLRTRACVKPRVTGFLSSTRGADCMRACFESAINAVLFFFLFWWYFVKIAIPLSIYVLN